MQPEILPRDLAVLYNELPGNEMAGNEELSALNFPSSSSTSCSYYAEVYHVHDPQLRSSEVTDQLKKCISGLKKTENHKVMTMDESQRAHQGHEKLLDWQPQFLPLKSLAFPENQGIGTLATLDKEHGFEGVKWCPVRWRSVEFPTLKFTDLTLLQDKDVGDNLMKNK